MVRAKRIAAVLLAAVTLFGNLCVSVGAAANGGFSWSLSLKTLMKIGRIKNQFEKKKEFSGHI